MGITVALPAQLNSDPYPKGMAVFCDMGADFPFGTPGMSLFGE